jgi:hypothetical protein
MTDMTAVSHPRRVPGPQPQDDYQQRIEHRDAEDEERGEHRQDRDMRTAGVHAHHRECGQQKTDEHRPGVTEEDVGARPVVRQEADARSAERGGDDGHGELVRAQIDHGERQRRDRPDAGAQPVHVVEEVDGIGDADDPQRGERDDRQRRPVQEEVEPDTQQRQAHAGHAGGSHLPEKLVPRREAADVIQEPGDQNDQ